MDWRMPRRSSSSATIGAGTFAIPCRCAGSAPPAGCRRSAVWRAGASAARGPDLRLTSRRRSRLAMSYTGARYALPPATLNSVTSVPSLGWTGRVEVAFEQVMHVIARLAPVPRLYLLHGFTERMAHLSPHAAHDPEHGLADMRVPNSWTGTCAPAGGRTRSGCAPISPVPSAPRPAWTRAPGATGDGSTWIAAARLSRGGGRAGVPALRAVGRRRFSRVS